MTRVVKGLFFLSFLAGCYDLSTVAEEAARRDGEDHTTPSDDIGVPGTPGSESKPVFECGLAASDALALCGPAVAAVTAGVAFPTIQAAIDHGAQRQREGREAAAQRDIAVCPGVHTESLTVEAAYLFSASGNAADTVLSGNNFGRILTAWNSSFAGLTFRDGYHDYDGGAMSVSGATTVECSVFENNHADYQGGAIAARGDLTIRDSLFFANTAGYEGAGVSFGAWEPGVLVVNDSDFVGNVASYEGAAIEIGTWAYDVVAITDSTFVRNRDGYGEGVVNFGSWGGFDAVVDGCSFEHNDQAIGLGGWLEDGFNLDVSRTTFVGDEGNWNR